MIKDFRVNIKVRNNRLIQAIEETGGRLGGLWCRSKGLNYNKVNDLIRLKDSPLQENQVDLTETAYKLCEILNKSPNELWSEDLINPLQMNNVAVELSAPEMKQIVYHSEYEPDKLLAVTEMQEKVQDIVERLTPIEQKVLKMRFFDDMTLEQVAHEFDVGRERIRQIEAKGLRKLRHPKLSSGLKSYLEDL